MKNRLKIMLMIATYSVLSLFILELFSILSPFVSVTLILSIWITTHILDGEFDR